MPIFYDQQQYDEVLREKIASVFSGRSIEDSADDEMSRIFTQSDWPVVGLPHEVQRAPTERPSAPLEGDYSAALVDAWVPFFESLRRIGEEDLIIAIPLRSYPGLMHAFGPARNTPVEGQSLAADCKFDKRDLAAAERGGKFMVYAESIVFGRVPVWGIVSHWEGFSILGGTSEFIRGYVEAAGGSDAVRRSFDIGLESALRTSTGQEKTDRFADRILRSMRWPA